MTFHLCCHQPGEMSLFLSAAPGSLVSLRKGCLRPNCGTPRAGFPESGGRVSPYLGSGKVSANGSWGSRFLSWPRFQLHPLPLGGARTLLLVRRWVMERGSQHPRSSTSPDSGDYNRTKGERSLCRSLSWLITGPLLGHQGEPCRGPPKPLTPWKRIGG